MVEEQSSKQALANKVKLAQQAQLCAEQQAQLARLRTKQQAQLAQLSQHAAEKAQECERRVRREAQEQLEPFIRATSQTCVLVTRRGRQRQMWNLPESAQHS